jgi:hypothetical protein
MKQTVWIQLGPLRIQRQIDVDEAEIEGMSESDARKHIWETQGLDTIFQMIECGHHETEDDEGTNGTAYSPFQYELQHGVLSHLDPGEPLFVLRANDPLGVEIINLWIAHARTAGIRAEKLEQAAATARAFKNWISKK